MSLAALAWALWHAETKDPTERVVLIRLGDHADPDGRGAYPSQRTLAGLDLTVRTVRRHLDALECRGLIRRGDQRLVDHIRSDRRPIVWDLDLSLRPVTHDRPVTDDRSSVVERPDTGGIHDRSPMTYKPKEEPSLNQQAAAKIDDQSNDTGAADVDQVLTDAGLPASWRADVAAALGRGCTVRQIVDGATAPITGGVRNEAAVRRTRLRDLTPTPQPAVTPTPPNVRDMCRTHNQPTPCPICAERATAVDVISPRPVTDDRSPPADLAVIDTTELKKRLSQRTPLSTGRTP